MEYDKYGLLTNTSGVDMNDNFEIFSDVEESDEYKRYIKNIYVRIMNENLRLFLEEYERKEKMIKMKKFKKTCGMDVVIIVSMTV
jgi:hypothetical protein